MNYSVKVINYCIDFVNRIIFKILFWCKIQDYYLLPLFIVLIYQFYIFITNINSTYLQAFIFSPLLNFLRFFSPLGYFLNTVINEIIYIFFEILGEILWHQIIVSQKFPKLHKLSYRKIKMTVVSLATGFPSKWK